MMCTLRWSCAEAHAVPAQQIIYRPAICLGSQLHVTLAITGVWRCGDKCIKSRNYELLCQSQMRSVTVRHLCEDDKVEGDSAKAAQDPGGAGAHHIP